MNSSGSSILFPVSLDFQPADVHRRTGQTPAKSCVFGTVDTALALWRVQVVPEIDRIVLSDGLILGLGHHVLDGVDEPPIVTAKEALTMWRFCLRPSDFKNVHERSIRWANGDRRVPHAIPRAS